MDEEQQQPRRWPDARVEITAKVVLRSNEYANNHYTVCETKYASGGQFTFQEMRGVIGNMLAQTRLDTDAQLGCAYQQKAAAGEATDADMIDLSDGRPQRLALVGTQPKEEGLPF